MKVLFITREGRDQPAARIRAYGFARELVKRGISAGVFSFADDLGAKAGKDDAGFSFFEKVSGMIKGYSALTRDNAGLFVINRANYHSLPAMLAARKAGVPYIFDMDDWEAREDTGRYLGVFPKSKAEYLTRVLARGSLFCVAASDYIRKYLLQYHKDVYLIPTAVDRERFGYAGKREGRDFVFSWHGSVNRPEIVGYLDFLIECFTEVRVKNNSACLRIFGDGIFGRELKNMINRKSCDGVEYMGWVRPDEMPARLAEVDAGVVPLLDASRFNLSKCPVKILEYMAAGKPVIASNVGEAGSIICDGVDGFL
ncbi:MAG: glycosyltransferase, partial [Candidatus Omnitrophota bacterium]